MQPGWLGGPRPYGWIWTVNWCRGVTYPRVTWSRSLPIRLRAGLLVYELLRVTISLEGLGHKLLLLSTTHSWHREGIYLILLPLPPFPFVYLGYVMYLVKFAHFLLAVPVYLMWPHHRLTALLHLYLCACNYQFFTDEGSQRLLKRLNYCFSVLASTTNRSI